MRQPGETMGLPWGLDAFRQAPSRLRGSKDGKVGDPHMGGNGTFIGRGQALPIL